MTIDEVFIRFIPNDGKTEEAKYYNEKATRRHCDNYCIGITPPMKIGDSPWRCTPSCTVVGSTISLPLDLADKLVKKGFADYDIFGNRGPDYRRPFSRKESTGGYEYVLY